MIITALAASLSLAPCPAGAHCLEDETLLAVSANSDRAAFILSAMQTAQARYGDVFSRTPGLTAVIEDSTQFPGLALELDAQGYTVKPWVSPQAMRDQLEAQLRPALEAQMAGAPEAVIDAAINSALSDRVDGNERVRHGEAIIAHELGHLWLRDTYDWPDIDTGGARTYGAAAAPDWFDETAAVLMESEQLTGERRSNLCEDLPDDISAQLSRYFTMEHPLLQMAALAADRAAAAARARGEAADGPQIMVMSGDALSSQGADMIGAERFYGLTRALVDYLMTRTGSHVVFDTLAQTLASGQSLEDWLASSPSDLPSSQAALIDDLVTFIESGCAA
ncbi:conserved exported hypothetical protein [Oceanicaulis sp. 350]|nr:conserved exported hypothetical protein [Oceanicaulis sp. 350]